MTRRRTMPRCRAPPPHDPLPRASTPCPAAVRHHPLSRRRARAGFYRPEQMRAGSSLPPSSVFFPASLPRTERLLLGGPAPLRLAVQPRRPRPFTVAAPPSVRATGSRARPLPKLVAGKTRCTSSSFVCFSVHLLPNRASSFSQDPTQPLPPWHGASTSRRRTTTSPTTCPTPTRPAGPGVPPATPRPPVHPWILAIHHAIRNTIGPGEKAEPLGA
ncbi:uncharacterized protein [Aegilops tauschii subsp. strangulata]|uniref:extensin isoform X2 n=1 Tax=Triticum aestivum TaxID=4565 RepID=UPI001D022A17|nr:extensin-like isoform X2 [Triticum aestivum]